MAESQRIAGESPARVRRWMGAAIYAIFFVSGATSLIYQVVWGRQFGLVFGITTYAIATVLAAFFAGLALGSFIAGRFIDRTRYHPLAVYGVMCGIVGVYVLLLPGMLRIVEAAYPSVYEGIGESFALFTLFRFLASFVLLLIPTTLMGATLPVMSKLMVDREDVLGLSVGRLYAINTFGAVAGTMAAGFVLIPTAGVFTSTLVAALGDLSLAAVSLLLSRHPVFAPSRELAAVAPAADAGPAPLTRADRIILALSFMSGVTLLALEVVWMRSLVLVLGSTTYAFSTMLTAVLIGLALGAAVFAPFADPARNRGAIVAMLFFTAGLCAALGPAVINALPFVFLRLFDWTFGVWWLLIGTQFVVCFMVVFVPTFLSGASFPILVRMYSRGVSQVGRTVADVYAIDTFGGIVGSLLGGFVLVKWLGLQPSLTAVSLVLMGVGGCLAMALAKPWGRSLRIGVAAAMAAATIALVFAHPRFDTKLLFGGWGPYAGGYFVSRAAGSTVDTTDRYMQRLLYHREGVTASVDVLESGWGQRILSINAKPVATTYLYDMRALKMLGHLPVLLHPEPRDVLIIGLGAGVSGGIIASYPAVENVTIVELCAEVPGAAAKFADWNYQVLDNPKVKIVIHDGANYVKAVRRQYDVISADPIHPFVSGAGTLYSREHWERSKERLREGGILAQWLPLYQLSPRDFATILRTFLEVFPNATMWYSGIDTVIVGSKGPFAINADQLAEHMSAPEVLRDLLSMGVHEPADVLSWYVAGPDEIAQMAQGAPLNTVDRPLIEFSAPKAVARYGVSATMPFLLSALEQTPTHEVVQRLSELTRRPLDGAASQNVATARETWRWVMRSQMSYSYGYMGQYHDALLRAYQLRPHDRFVRRALADAQWSFGDVRWSEGYLREALELFRAAFENDPDSASALTAAIGVSLQLGDLLGAESLLARASPAQQEVFQVLVAAGQLALARNDYTQAEQAFRRAADRGQESPTMHAGLGLAALRRGDQRAAYTHFDRAIAIATSPADTIYDILTLCSGHGFSSAARPYAESLASLVTRAIAADPGSPGLYDYRALAYSILGRDAEAERDWATARSLRDWWQEPAPLLPLPEDRGWE